MAMSSLRRAPTAAAARPMNAGANPSDSIAIAHDVRNTRLFITAPATRATKTIATKTIATKDTKMFLFPCTRTAWCPEKSFLCVLRGYRLCGHRRLRGDSSMSLELGRPDLQRELLRRRQRGRQRDAGHVAGRQARREVHARHE